ncbi:DUF5958 family protein [Larkinella punicea]|uniref:Uncharacterized protein n=1 Tax=Larkinella punicea TaxID=2315727 RepID=A0A368JSV7_9BACT|nr:DUF5958 family protein [Larkinella punicea]RCR70046.1 hypothetical protein DUE52_09495 [Larkinella punicea]
MTLEEEIAIVRFGQGVLSHDELLAHFSQLDEDLKMKRIFELYHLIDPSKLVDTDIEQALVASALGEDYQSCVVLRGHRLSRVRLNITESAIEKDYILLLNLFKIAYQSRLASIKEEKSKEWRYRDLSDDETVQALLSAHRELVEEVYNNPGFRSEFTSLAKLWKAHNTVSEARHQESAPVRKSQTGFLSYDEVMTESVESMKFLEEMNKYSRVMAILNHALKKALSIQYGLGSSQADRLIKDVMKRHS